MSFGKAVQDFHDKSGKGRRRKAGEARLGDLDRARRAEEEKKKKKSKMEQFADKLYGGSN